MARIWDEKFEGAGYEETWNPGETINGSSTIDENADSADVSSPSGWDSQCLKIVCAGAVGNEVYVKHEENATAYPILYSRLEVVLTAESLADAQQDYLAWVFQSAAGFKNAYVLTLYQTGGSLYFRLLCYNTGTGAYFLSLNAITIGIRYRIEVKWDATGDVWAWKIDGVAQPNNIDATAPVESEGTLTSTHATALDSWVLGMPDQEDGAAATVYMDLFALDNADWVGAEAAGGGAAEKIRVLTSARWR